MLKPIAEDSESKECQSLAMATPTPNGRSLQKLSEEKQFSALKNDLRELSCDQLSVSINPPSVRDSTDKLQQEQSVRLPYGSIKINRKSIEE